MLSSRDPPWIWLLEVYILSYNGGSLRLRFPILVDGTIPITLFVSRLHPLVFVTGFVDKCPIPPSLSSVSVPANPFLLEVFFSHKRNDSERAKFQTSTSQVCS